MGWDSANSKIRALKVDASQNLLVAQSAGPWTQNLTQWASTTLGTPTNFGTTPGAVIAASVNASIFAGTTALSATGSSLNANITNATLAVTQSGAPWSQNLTQLNSVALGSPSAYGTSPGAVNVLGVNAFVTNTVTVSGTVTANQGGAPWSQNLTQWASTALGTPTNFGTTPGAVVVGSVNSSLFIGTVAAVAASSGVQKVGITGNTGAAMDAAGQNAVSPANELLVAGQFNTTPTTISEGNVSPLQVNAFGSLKCFLTGNSVDIGINIDRVGSTLVTGDNTTNAPTKVPVLPARANAAAQTWTEGNQVPLSVDLAGNLRTSGTSTPAVLNSFRTDTFTTAGNGVTVDVSANPLKSFSVQVTGTGAAATTWDVRLEGSLDNVNFTQILQHTNVTGDGAVQFGGAALAPARFFRSRAAGLTLGGATNIVVAILGVQ